MRKSLANFVLLPSRLFFVALVSIAVIGLAETRGARAQDCEAMTGPARTDCFIGRTRILGAQSDIAAGSARLRSSQERLRAVTGGSYEPAPRRAKSKHRAHRR